MLQTGHDKSELPVTIIGIRTNHNLASCGYSYCLPIGRFAQTLR